MLNRRPVRPWIEVPCQLSCRHLRQNGVPKNMQPLSGESSGSDGLQEDRNDSARTSNGSLCRRLFRRPHGITVSAEVRQNERAASPRSASHRDAYSHDSR